MEIGPEGCTPEDIARVIFIKYQHGQETFKSKLSDLAIGIGLKRDEYVTIVQGKDTVSSKLVALLYLKLAQGPHTVEEFTKCLKKTKLSSAAKTLTKEFLSPSAKTGKQELPMEEQEEQKVVAANLLQESTPSNVSSPSDNISLSERASSIWTAVYSYKRGLPFRFSLFLIICILFSIIVYFVFKSTKSSIYQTPPSSLLVNMNVSVADQLELISKLQASHANNINLSIIMQNGKWNDVVHEESFSNVVYLTLLGKVDVAKLYVILPLFKNINSLSIQPTSQGNCDTNTFKSDMNAIELKELKNLTLEGHPLCQSSHLSPFFELKLPSLTTLTINYYEFKAENQFDVASLIQGSAIVSVHLSLQLSTTLKLHASSQSRIPVSTLYMRNKQPTEVDIPEEFCDVFPNLSKLTLKNFLVSCSKVKYILPCTSIRFLNICILMQYSCQLETLNIWTNNILLESVNLHLIFAAGQCPTYNEFKTWLDNNKRNGRQLTLSSDCPLKSAGGDLLYEVS